MLTSDKYLFSFPALGDEITRILRIFSLARSLPWADRQIVQIVKKAKDDPITSDPDSKKTTPDPFSCFVVRDANVELHDKPKG